MGYIHQTVYILTFYYYNVHFKTDFYLSAFYQIKNITVMAKLNVQHSLHSHNPSEIFVVSLFVGVKYINETEKPK